MSSLLRALSHVPGFGWAADAADALDAAARKAGDLSRAINGIPPTKHVVITFDSRGFSTIPGVISAAAAAAGRNASGTPYWKGGLTWVGESGAELADLPAGSKIYSHGKSMAMAAAASERAGSAGARTDGDVLGEVNVYLDGQQIQKSLIRRKRLTGQPLGLA